LPCKPARRDVAHNVVHYRIGFGVQIRRNGADNSERAAHVAGGTPHGCPVITYSYDSPLAATCERTFESDVETHQTRYPWTQQRVANTVRTPAVYRRCPKPTLPLAFARRNSDAELHSAKSGIEVAPRWGPGPRVGHVRSGRLILLLPQWSCRVRDSDLALAHCK
jgi:hypothetical protein